MSDISDAVGTAAEGGLISNAVEGEKSTVSKRPSGDEGTCLNCGTATLGPHCHGCGQKVHVHRSLAAIGHDLMHGVLHLDGKLWRTLPLLAFKPGKITRRYVEGERAKFVSPMAMFLFSVFLMFAVFQIAGIGAPSDLSFGDEGKATLAESEQNWVAERADRERALAQIPEGAPEREAAEAALAEADENLGELRALRGLIDGEEAEGAGTDVQASANSGTDLRGIPWLAKLVDKWAENPSLMLYKLQANGYKFSWLLIPLSVPFVWLLFAWKRRFKAYDHAVFVTYSLSFMSLLFVIVSLVALSPVDGNGGWAFTIFATLAPLHLYKHLKHTYDLSRFSTLWRFFALLVFILIVVILFLQALLLLGAF